MLEFALHFCLHLFKRTMLYQQKLTGLVQDNLLFSRLSKVKKPIMIGEQQNERIKKPHGHKPITRTVVEFDAVYTFQLVHRLNLERPRRYLSPKTLFSLPLSLKY